METKDYLNSKWPDLGAQPTIQRVVKKVNEVNEIDEDIEKEIRNFEIQRSTICKRRLVRSRDLCYCSTSPDTTLQEYTGLRCPTGNKNFPLGLPSRLLLPGTFHVYFD